MPSLIAFDSVRFAWPDGRTLFENLDLAVGRNRFGVVGRNGAGKTTFLALAAGELAPTAGVVRREGAVAVLRQSWSIAPPPRVGDLMGAGAALDRITRIESGAADDADFAEVDWDLPQRLRLALARMGLSGVDPLRPTVSLSGGEATRAALAALLVSEPAILLLDEPTNNLDEDGRAAVGELLRAWQGCALVVSHDRELLYGMDDIVEISSHGARTFGHSYALYVSQREAETAASARALADAEKAQAKVARELQAARERQARRDAAGRRARARGDQPKMMLDARAERAEGSGGKLSVLAERMARDAREQLEAAQARVERVRALDLDLPPCGLAPGKSVLIFEDVGFAWPDGRVMFRDLSFRLVGPRKVALRGPNGSGKSTLVGLALGRLAPASGRIIRGVKAVFLDQRTGLLDDDGDLIANYLRINPAAGERQAHAAMARFLFRNTAASVPVGRLSGGERLRAALACVLLAAEPPRLIVLDEPTNHMDLDSIAAVEDALAAYDGALIVASHDVAFLDAIGVDRTITLGGEEVLIA
jgi:ATPase subunit of ABC transporter with duplicated ATPase domains